MFTSMGAAAANPTQIAENMPSSLVGLASAIPGGPRDHKPKYGLSMRFKVTVAALNDLGHWGSCQGLRVDYKPIEAKSGGSYTSTRWLPGEATYQKIVLKRAVDPESSRVVQSWLRNAAIGWIDGTQPNDGPTTATIVLLDAEGEPVLTWRLHDVRPWAWGGPDLDANNSKVAIETLELVHGGFEVEVHGAQPPRPTSRPAGPGDVVQKLTLKPARGSGKPVEFEHKPLSITIERNTESGPIRAVEGGELEAGTRARVTALALPKLVIGGEETMADVERLVTWASPRSITIGGHRQRGQSDNDSLPRLRLDWGTFKYEVNIIRLNATYTRFTNGGKPVRAEVQLTLKVLKKIVEPTAPTPPQNPHSGGIPGRSAHTMVDAENLPLLAGNHYGNANNWRDIAEANGVDDPLRVRPGTRLYLPAHSELGR